MENSFKKFCGYEKSFQSDGTFLLKFKRRSPLFNPVVNFFLSLMAGSVISTIFSSGQMFFIGAAAVFVAISKTLGKKAHEIEVIPGAGVKFSGKSLPFSDITHFDLLRHGLLGSNLLAITGGAKISLSGLVADEIAEGLKAEIESVA